MCMRHESHSDCGLHSHEFHELVLILNGRGSHLTNDAEMELSAGDVFLIRGRMSHGYVSTEHLTLVNILFDPHLLGLPMRYLNDLPGYHALFRIEPRLRRRKPAVRRLRLEPAELAEAAEMTARLSRELADRKPGYRFSACTMLMTLINLLCRCYFRKRMSGDRSLQDLSKVLSHIDRHFKEHLTVTGLSRIAGMSESTLNRHFHRIMGCSPLEHLIRTRIGYARELLRIRGMRVTEAAYECGFNDSNYFSRQFRKVVGMSPIGFQRRIGARHPDSARKG